MIFMMMIAYLALAGGFIHAQSATLDRVAGIGSTGNDFGNAIALDSSGNSYVVGQFNGTMDFDPGPGDASRVSNATDAFIAKYDSAGGFLWVITISSAGTEAAYNVTVDGTGDVYVVGQFQNSPDFDPGAGIVTRTATSIDAFIAKYTSAGAYAWVQAYGGASNDRARGVAVAGSAVFAAAENQETGVSQQIDIRSFSSADGTPGLALLIGGTGSDVPYSMIANSSGTQIYVSGQFNSVVDFDPGAGTVDRTSVGGNDAFVLCLDNGGVFQWVATAGAAGSDIANGLAIDGAGNVLVAGQFANTVDFDPGAGTSELTSAGSTDIFAWKLTSGGALVWARPIGGTGADIGSGIGVDSNNNPILVGQFAGTIGSCPLSVTSAGESDGLIVKWLSDGTLINLNGIGGTNFDDVRGVSMQGDLANVTGVFRLTADFDPGPGVTSLTNTGSNTSPDVYFARYSSFPSQVPSQSEIALFQVVTEITDGTLTPVDFGSTGLGSPITLTFTIQNSGSAALTLANLTVDGNSLPTNGYSNPGGFPASVAAGSSATFDFRLDAASAGTFSGTVAFDNSDCDEGTFSFPITGTVSDLPSMQIAKIVDGTSYPRLNYTISITNTGSGPAANVVFTDPIPNGTSFYAGSIKVDGNPISDDPNDAEGGYDPAIGVVIRIGTVAPGQTVTVGFQVTHVVQTVGWIYNQASLSGDNFSPLNSDDPATGSTGDPTGYELKSSMVPVPTLGEVGLIALMLLLGSAGAYWVGYRRM